MVLFLVLPETWHEKKSWSMLYDTCSCSYTYPYLLSGNQRVISFEVWIVVSSDIVHPWRWRRSLLIVSYLEKLSNSDSPRLKAVCFNHNWPHCARSVKVVKYHSYIDWVQALVLTKYIDRWWQTIGHQELWPWWNVTNYIGRERGGDSDLLLHY